MFEFEFEFIKDLFIYYYVKLWIIEVYNTIRFYY